MRADRLLSEILLLQSGRQLTGREIARRLEISERTVHRDMDCLSAAGVPVFALRGARGGWHLEEGWRMRVPGLDESELRALLMAQPRLLGDSRLAAAAERALGKLMAALPGPLHQQATSIRERLYVDANAWRASTENLAMLPVVQEAVSRDRKLKIRYRKSGHEALKAQPTALRDRVVDPLGLVAKGSSWYLVAQTTAGFRTFRVSRIETATVLPKPCQRPRGFDLAAYWKSSTEEFQRGWAHYEAVLSLEPRAAELMKQWRTTQAMTSSCGANGWITLRVQFEQEDEACFVVQGLGASVEVVEPNSLRERVSRNAAAMMQRLSSQTKVSL